MAIMKVEENLATSQSFKFKGTSIVTMKELPSSDECWPDTVQNNQLIQCEQGATIGFQWSVSGCLVPLLKCSKWKIQLFMEKWGETEFDLGSAGIVNVPFVGTSGHLYTQAITLRPNTIPEGVYDVVAVLRLYDTNNNPVPVAGFAELGKVEFYQAS